MEFTKRDWTLLREKLPEWQEVKPMDLNEFSEELREKVLYLTKENR